MKTTILILTMVADSNLVQIQLMSDLHLETPKSRPTYNEFVIQPQCKYLALLGDIGIVKDQALFHFLELQLQHFDKVFFVLGNHEPYQSTHYEATKAMQQFEIDIKTRRKPTTGEFIFLHRTRHNLSEAVTILGCTLQSRISQDQMQTVSMFCSDFQEICDWTVEMHNDAHGEDLTWLNEQVSVIQDTDPNRRIMVMSHHCPTMSRETASPSHLEDANGIRTAFSADLSQEICWTSPQVVVWAFGHTHFNCDYIDKATGKRVIANQKGYRRNENVDFDSNKVVDIGGESLHNRLQFP
jgi:predicted phosphodiesterase